MKGRYKIAAAVAAILIAYSAYATSLSTPPTNPVIIIDLPERACVEAGCLHPQAYATIVYAPSPPAGKPYIAVRYLSPGSKALFSLPPELYATWANYLVNEEGPALPSIGVVVLAYTSKDIAYSIIVLADPSSPLAPVSPGVREVSVGERGFKVADSSPPSIPRYGSPGNVPEGLRWGDVVSAGVPMIDESPVVIGSGVGVATHSPYVGSPVRLSTTGAQVRVSGTPAVVRSSGGTASISAYLGDGLYAVTLTYEGIPVYVAGVVRTAYAGVLAGVNATVSLNITVTAWVDDAVMIPLLYPLSLNSTLLLWLPAPLVFVEGVSPSLTEDGKCREVPMRVGEGGATIEVGKEVGGLYAGELTPWGTPYEVSLKVSLLSVGADAAVMAYSSSPVVEVGVDKDILGSLCVVGHAGSGSGGGCVGGYCPS